ncbi:MAG TPA: tetratricopeptide repeat protein [Terriglobales bacterium]|jgi:hypothetical protein
MDCREADREELVEKYVSGQLDPEAQDDFEVHILECETCLRAVEVCQTLREELAERAHEIRGQTKVRRAWLSWLIPAVALAMIVVGLGVYQVRKLYRAPAVASVPRAAPTIPGPADAGNLPSGNHDLTLSSDSSAKAPSPPVRNSKSPTHSSQLATRSQDAEIHATDQAPDATLAKSGGQAKKDEVVVPLPSTGQDSKEKAATATIQPAAEPANTQEVEAELFRLGTVQPPPYAFAGTATTKTQPGKGLLGSGLSENPRHPGLAKRPGFESAMVAYIEGHYERAASLLEEDLKTEPLAPDANFYLGVCQLLVGRPAASIPFLRTALAKEKSQWIQPAHFHLAKAYIQTRDLAAAEKELKAAAAMPGKLSGQAAADLARLQALKSAVSSQ